MGIATATIQPNYVKRVSKEGPKYNEPLPKSLRATVKKNGQRHIHSGKT